jgi:hypothetical protein
MRLAPLLLLVPLGGCAAFRLPADQDPDRSRHAFEIVGEVRRQDGLAVVPGATLEVLGARQVAGSTTTDATGRFWVRVEGITAGAPDPAGSGTGPAGSVRISARGAGLCAPETRVLLPAASPVILLLGKCP